MQLLGACLFVGVLWLLVFLPLVFFTRRFEIWGWRKAGLLGCLLGFPLLVLLSGRNEGEPFLVALIFPALYGLCIGLMFTLGSIVTREGWQRKLGLTQLWVLLIGGTCILVVPPRPKATPDVFRPPVAIPPAGQILSTLNKEHPRLLMTAGDFAQLKQRVASDELMRQWHAKLRNEAESIFTQPLCQYEIQERQFLQFTSRRVLARVYTLGLLYRLDGEMRYAERTWQELETAAKFKDWSPGEFLNPAEMTHAFAIGYDWLYDVWTEPQRAVLRTAMVEKGLKLALAQHSERRWWTTARRSWNQVCNGGMGLGAMALADVEPQLAADFLYVALQSVQLPMVEYGPDGGWAEGPMYWHLGTLYNVVFLAALQTALGTDFGLTKIPGFSETCTFPIYATGPTGLSFNYADAGAARIPAPELFWLARQFNRPEYAIYRQDDIAGKGQNGASSDNYDYNKVFGTFQRQGADGLPLDLIWYDAGQAKPPTAPLPLDKYYRHTDVVTMRSAWNDTNALFVGFKAGDNQAAHNHLDLGSFVLEAIGVRWAVDLGTDNYGMPGYFDSSGQRWSYYRLRAEGHNTLVINPGVGPDQNRTAMAPIVRFQSRPDRSFAIADLTAAYASQAKHVSRGIALLNRKQVLIQDEIQTDKPTDLWWFLHTATNVEARASGDSAMLTHGDVRLAAQVLWPKGATFAVIDAEPLPSSPNPGMQNKNQGIRKLAIHRNVVGESRLGVLLTPLREGETAPALTPAQIPLANW